MRSATVTSAAVPDVERHHGGAGDLLRREALAAAVRPLLRPYRRHVGPRLDRLVERVVGDGGAPDRDAPVQLAGAH
jgi:hypothetical protein